MKTRTAPGTTVLTVLVLLLVTGCGGGGGSKTVLVPSFSPPDLFQGYYGFVGLSGTQGGPEEFIAEWGGVSAIDDMASTSSSANLNGAVGVIPGHAGTNPYFVHGDRRFGRRNPFTGLITTSGGITPEGDVAIAMHVQGGSRPGLDFHVRRGVALDASVLTGSYFFASFGMQIAGSETTSRWGRAQFDGVGAGTLEVSVNAEGVTAGPGMTDFTYVVSANGGTTLDLLGAQSLSGTCSPDGEFLVLAGGVGLGDDPLVIVLVKEGTGFSDASLEGTWFVVGVSQEVGPDTYRTFSGALFADPAGAVTLLGTENVEGVVLATPEDTATAGVAPDGELTLSTPGGDTYTGGLSANGRFGVLAGTTNPGGDPGMYVLIR